MRPTILIGARGAMLALAAAAAASAPAQQDPAQARGLVAACFTCHGTDGRSVGGIPPSLAGQNRDLLLQAMKDFRDGKRPATIMHQQAKGYTDRELEAIAAYFAAQKPGPGTPAPSPAARGGY
ncbi:MAG TPA: cytochrome c [Burkholderiales bacterium]|nr:cytochrome c [Burkholderiales bacterium]